jgi:hypothetical protein
MGGNFMADLRYNVNHDVDNNELREIRDLLSQLKSEDTCTILVDRVDSRNADRVIGNIDADEYDFYTKGIHEDQTQIIVTRK